ncbi:MAG: hypothetical protein H6526_08995 [Actinobacteria bacterium]|nr:hypothetical protein [Actinomycetota bacterium]
MAVSTHWYAEAIVKAFNKELDFDTDTIKVALLSGYTPSQAHNYFDDVSADEISGTGYTAGGATLGSKTLVSSGGVATFDAADTSWSSSTLSATHAVVYLSTGTASTSPLLCYVDFGGTVASTGGTFAVTWNASGILTATAS